MASMVENQDDIDAVMFRMLGITLFGCWLLLSRQGDQLAIGKESQTWNGNKHVSLFRLFKEYAQAVGTNKPHGRICLSKVACYEYVLELFVRTKQSFCHML
ncbi:hypothetical protein AtNW77_Chr1g0044771 [Arabidopsis thaliana]